jgi:hypothetical protein
LQIAKQMWSDNDGPFHGKHYQLQETLCQPQPVGHARPPILVGGGGEQKTLKLVARYADACNLFAMPGEEGLNTLRHKLEVLRQHCEREGRDYKSIEKTVLGPFPGTIEHPMAMAPTDFTRFVESLEPLGIDTYVSAAIDRTSLQALVEAAEPLRTASATA